ncbi:hypothetical protein DPMN_123994 [Dreissena polymorpha]|uniref:Uncharacterized protein n=1 Tax=Dreissena polymorpha TaxID=45954 RepID=A0A9D4GSF1_DREPO|nr:hypothetical protein DPMN_123994 [Dreissena polymorpha]
MLATETTTREQVSNCAGSEADQATGLMKDGDQSRKDVPTLDVGTCEHSTRLES